MFSNAKKLEDYYPHIFTAKINTHIAGGDVLSREFYIKLKEIIFTQQAQSAWMPEEKVRVSIINKIKLFLGKNLYSSIGQVINQNCFF